MNEPFIPHDTNEVGSYRRDFDIPADWTGQPIFLHIGAAGAAYYIWVNGEKVGYSEDSKLPSEFDLTKFVKPGKNTIAIELYRYADGSYLEDQDFWRVSGIERSVYVYAEGATRLRDYTVGKVYLGIANMNPDDNVVLSVGLGSLAAKKVSGQVMTAQKMDQFNEFGKPPSVAAVPYHGATLAGGTLKLDIPAKSVVVVSLE